MFFGEPFGGLVPGAFGAVLSVLLRTGAPLTGRQIHGLLSDDHSLWSVQEALKTLARLGLIETQTFGRANVHQINEAHAAVAPLRDLADPIASLRATVHENLGDGVETVLLFGSIARGEATPDSDIDLAVIAPPGWAGHLELEDAVRSRLGSNCDVLVFSREEFGRLADEGEPVVSHILRDGVVLFEHTPRTASGAA
jgi:predicted nucleotidyltransferase